MWITTVGDNVVDCYPDLGLMYPGGNMVNVAVHARRLGAASAYLGAVGTDPAGVLVRESLAAEGVDLSLLRVVDGRNAWAAIRLIDGNRHFGDADAGVSKFRLTDADLERLGESDLVHTGECSMIEDQLSTLRTAVRNLSFDFSERPWEYVEAHAPLVDVAIISIPQSAAEPAVALAGEVSALGPATVAVTMGSAGAVLMVDGKAVSAPAPPVTVVDTLGAGDAFIARLLLGLVRGEEPAEVVAAATAYASQSCMTYGAFGYPAELPANVDLHAQRPPITRYTCGSYWRRHVITPHRGVQMNRKPKHMLAALLGGTALIAVTACGGGGSNQEAGTQPELSAPPTKAGTLTWSPSSPTRSTHPIFATVAKAYEAANPGVKIDLQQVGDQPYKDKIRVLSASKSCPDIYFSWAGDFANKFIQGNLAADLTSVVGPSTEWGKTFSQAALKAFEKDGKNYGVPINLDAKYLAYNKAAFVKAGLSGPPTQPRRAADRLRQAQVRRATRRSPSATSTVGRRSTTSPS